MSDQRIRAAERAWQADSTPANLTKLLRELASGGQDPVAYLHERELLPPECAPEGEPVKFLSSKKRALTKRFGWKRFSTIRDLFDFAHWLFVFERFDEARAVCRFLTHPQAPDAYQVEYPFTLLAHIQRLAGEVEAAKGTLEALLAVHTVNPVNRDSSFPPEGARRRETPKEQLVTSFYYARNLVFSREVGGCQSASEAELDRQLEATYAELRELVPRAEVKAKKRAKKKTAKKKTAKKKTAKKKTAKKKAAKKKAAKKRAAKKKAR